MLVALRTMVDWQPLNASLCNNRSLIIISTASGTDALAYLLTVVPAEEEHAWSIFIHVSMLAICLFAAFILFKVKSLYFSHSGAALVTGLVGGIIVKYGIVSSAIEVRTAHRTLR